jgi:hypothetical protein
MEAGKALALNLLPKLGFSVDEVPVANGRTADLLVTDGESQPYLIEVKEKVESESHAQERIKILSRGDLYEQADPLTRDNRISGILQDARKQLDETPKDSSTFQLIWFHATGVDADLKYRQAFATFYGHVDLIAMNPRSHRTPACFYFDYCAAFNMPTIEALIITDSKQLQVCLNEFSHRGVEFRQSALCKRFAEMDGVIDPVAMAADGMIIACRVTVPRKNDDEVAKALQEQTGVLYSPIRLTRHAVSAATRPQR